MLVALAANGVIAVAKLAGGLISGSTSRGGGHSLADSARSKDSPAVVRVEELLTMVLGPRSLLVPARVDLDDDGVRAGEVERAATALERALRDAVPDVTEVFLDPTPGRG